MKAVVSSFLLLTAAVVIGVVCSGTVCELCRTTEQQLESLPKSIEDLSPKETDELLTKVDGICELWEDRTLFLAVCVPAQTFGAVRSSLFAVRDLIEAKSEDEYSAARSHLVTLVRLMRESEEFSLKSIF